MRPSELYDITDPFVAYCFDEAVATFGNFVKGELDKVEGQSKDAIEGAQAFLLKALLSDDESARYAAPPVKRTNG